MTVLIKVSDVDGVHANADSRGYPIKYPLADDKEKNILLVVANAYRADSSVCILQPLSFHVSMKMNLQ